LIARKEENYIRISPRIICCICFSLLLLNINHCFTTSIGLTASSTNLDQKNIEKDLGYTEGSHSSWAFFSSVDARASFDKAVETAVKRKNADALIKMSWEENSYKILIFTIKRITVRGNAVILKEKP
jgi:hypothetical protein